MAKPKSDLSSPTHKTLLSRPLDAFYVVYFVIHLIASILIDMQVFIPRHLVPKLLASVLDNYIKDSNDPLMGAVMSGKKGYTWFWTSLVSEQMLQTPVMALASWALWKDDKRIYSILIAYSMLACFSTTQCMATYLFGHEGQTLSSSNLQTLLQANAPWVIIPGLMLIDMLIRCNSIMALHKSPTSVKKTK